jgi:hypothetical protein
MKYVATSGLILLLASFASAQSGVGSSAVQRYGRVMTMQSSTDGQEEDPKLLIEELAKQVDSLVAAYQEGLRLISAAVDSGKMTPEAGQALSSDSAHFVVSRLETLAKLYGTLISDQGDSDDPDTDAVEADLSLAAIRCGDPSKGDKCRTAWNTALRAVRQHSRSHSKTVKRFTSPAL